jgi:oligopeptide/dipeptide ABC transporter ATP-binding protein
VSAPAGTKTPGSASPSTVPLLEVENLVATYPVRRGLVGALRREPRRAVRAVDGVSFSVARGEMVALVGESGCGKTTTAQTILRLFDPTSGTIRFDGRDITAIPARALRTLRKRMQMIYQDPYESLDPRFRVRQAIEEPLLVHKIGGTSQERRRIVIDAMRRAELSPPELYLDRYPHELSGGQRQRVAIAASLVLGPELLVADEPVSMLDVSVRAGVLSLLDGLRRRGDMGILMITHDLSTAAHFADRIVVMYLGRIVEEGPAREVVHDPRHPYTKALLSVVPRRDPRDRTRPQVLAGEAPDPVDVPSGCRFHPRCPVVEDRCRTIDPALRVAVPAHRAACVLVDDAASHDDTADQGGTA